MKVFVKISLLIIVASLPSSCRQTTGETRHSPEAEALLSLLMEISGREILSGQHNYSHSLNQSTDSIIAITGKTPVIWGSDFGIRETRAAMIDSALARHKEGHIITLMYHQGSPVDSIPRDVNPVRYIMNEAEWENLITPGSVFHQRWIADIDRVAEWLKVLKEKNVPVLWRPYHEMNGMWFWWGNKPGERGIQLLWKMMYERFSNHHKLNNLIWVWNANAPRDWKNDEAYPYEWFYPGAEYTDILAADVYKGDYKQSHHDKLLALANGKPIALGEIGAAPDPSIFETQNQWCWFMMWANWPWTHNSPEQLNALYDYPLVIDFEEFKVSPS